MVVNPKDDPYLRDLDDDEKSDIEDFNIKPTDNLILVGHVEGNAAILEVYGTISQFANLKLTICISTIHPFSSV